MWKLEEFTSEGPRLSGPGLTATDDQMGRLVAACELHSGSYISTDPTVGACQDADRLDLGRVGIKPGARYLSTEAAKEEIAGDIQNPPE